MAPARRSERTDHDRPADPGVEVEVPDVDAGEVEANDPEAPVEEAPEEQISG